MPRTWRPNLRALVALLSVAVLCAPAAFAQPTNVLLILDASGSMYMRLADGQYRITAAKEALSEFVTRLPEDPDLNVGLRVYGSRTGALDEGACEDSVLVVPVEGFQRDELLSTVRTTQARGATPIAYSLELAADDLRDAEGHKVVVLVTDGAESCGGDVRGAVERLAAEGLEVELWIIGFALTDAAARSFEGLGKFVNTASAVELASALGQTVELVPEAQAYPVTVTLTRQGEPAVDGARVRFIDAVAGGAIDFGPGVDGVFTAELPAGSYRAEVADAYAPEPLEVPGLAVAPAADNAFAFELEAPPEVVIAVDPLDPAAGSSVTASYGDAPAGERDWLAVSPADAGDEVYLDWSWVPGPAGEVELQVPDYEGEFQVRYHLALPEGGTRVVGRSPVFVSRAVTAEISGPGEVAIGAGFEVAWQGPDNQNDFVTIVEVGADEAAYRSWAYTRRGSPVTLTAPIEPGEYELRYVSGQSNLVLVRQPITVTAVDSAVQGPERVAAGASFEVHWQGPDSRNDYITIVETGAREGAYRSYAYTRGGSPVTLTAPIEPGDYELRYVAGQGNLTLAAAPITVTAVDTAVQGPDSVTAGASFEVHWQGPDSRNDYITIVETGAREGAYRSYAYTGRGSPVTLTAPIEPGEYELRYVAGQGNLTLAAAPITVTPVAVGLQAPTEVDAGAPFEVHWQGPDSRNDYVTIVEAGAREGAYLSYVYTRRGSPVTLTAPDEPGEYEVRYVFGEGNRTLAALPIRVR